MHSSAFIISLILALAKAERLSTDCPSITSDPAATPTDTQQLPAGHSYLSGYPICNITGIHWEPGPCRSTTHAVSGTTLLSCMTDCRKTCACESIAWNSVRGDCNFLTMKVEECQVDPKHPSQFAFFDRVCVVT
ncbi:hypothetical protein BKA65DRAFT_561767 [Rhexocercosporidium sp. MPI-PUGE-AT-0058]|nr:hypothetical protein BKA65DRAFT_561767 [Rhexocercosporidium sp. MPI-PUGE-AT-0058]